MPIIKLTKTTTDSTVTSVMVQVSAETIRRDLQLDGVTDDEALDHIDTWRGSVVAKDRFKRVLSALPQAHSTVDTHTDYSYVRLEVTEL